jgi:hypothetical protein
VVNAVDYAIICGNTFIHVASTTGGHSAGDLFIELQGSHAAGRRQLPLPPISHRPSLP